MSIEASQAELACPQCRQIDQVAAVPAVVSAGTSSYAGRGSTAGYGSGIAVGAGGVTSSFGVSRGTGTYSGTVQSDLAYMLAPAPQEFARTERGNCLSALVFIIAFPIWVGWFLKIWITASRRNRRVAKGRPAALAIWSQAWYCHRCGGAYFPGDNYDDGKSPNLPRHTLLPPPAFQQLVWEAGGYQDLLRIAR